MISEGLELNDLNQIFAHSFTVNLSGRNINTVENYAEILLQASTDTCSLVVGGVTLWDRQEQKCLMDSVTKENCLRMQIQIPL